MYLFNSHTGLVMIYLTACEGGIWFEDFLLCTIYSKLETEDYSTAAVCSVMFLLSYGFVSNVNVVF